MTRLPLFVIAATFASQALAVAKPVAATPTGEPVNCIPIVQIDHTLVRDERTIDFVMRGGKKQVYRNVLPDPCPELGLDEGISYETSLSQLCNTDIISVLRRFDYTRPSIKCGLGQFQPVSLSADAG